MTDTGARFAIGARSHPGMVRANNEDAYVAEDGLFVVADGMGGHQAGEVASALAVEVLRTAYTNGLSSVTELERAVRDANSSIRMQAAETVDRAGMGTTITGLVFLTPNDDDPTPRLAIANVGDSRTYLHRGRALVRLTIDHSYVQELVRTGQITEQEARFHPRRNIVTRALGIDHNVAVDAWVRACVRGDRYLVCSDGLVDEVPDHEIAAVLDGVSDPQAAADQLVEMANRHGGRDNTTVIVVDVLDGLDAPPADDVIPAGAIDDGGLPADITWADAPTSALPTTPSPTVDSPTARADATQVLPFTPEVRSQPVMPAKRRFGLPQLLFLFALGAIAMVVIVVALVATGNESPDAPPTTVAPATTSSAVTSTTARTTTARTTTARTTVTSATTLPATTAVPFTSTSAPGSP